MVISGFAGIGKTTLSKRYGGKVYDLESSLWNTKESWKYATMDAEKRKGLHRGGRLLGWERKYVDEVEKLIAKGYLVMVACNKEVRDELASRCIDYVVVAPREEVFYGEYEGRYRGRGNNEKYIEGVMGYYGKFKESLGGYEEVYYLGKGEYLADLVKEEGWL